MSFKMAEKVKIFSLPFLHSPWKNQMVREKENSGVVVAREY
jgi:hypothetical protein